MVEIDDDVKVVETVEILIVIDPKVNSLRVIDIVIKVVA